MVMAAAAGTGCRKHGNRKQVPGVCSSCLRERLAEIPGAEFADPHSGGDDESSCSSGSSSGWISPRGHRRIPCDGRSSFAFSATAGDGGRGRAVLKKSNSIAFVAGGCGGGGRKKEKEGFWSKLIRSTGKKTRRVFLL
ncbi:unnamed protein product [Cuscuta campestris]|uniref:Uncharacterized protein n=1 Tax=Cuscuta campestris TaxID=132261 RepID=A0A484L1F5_9ASTE|nr:unnamed protein product [Cuscuta campestris]